MSGLSFERACSTKETPKIRTARRIARKEALLFWVKSHIRTCSIAREFPSSFKGSNKSKIFYSYDKIDPGINPLSIFDEGRKKYSYIVFYSTPEEVDGVSIFLKQANVGKKVSRRGLSGHTTRTILTDIGNILIIVPKTQKGETKCRVKVNYGYEELVRNIMQSLGISLSKNKNVLSRQADDEKIVFWQYCHLE